MATFSVKNWEKYQHYKDRNPPWIKLYKTILSDYEFCRLPDASKFHYIAIMLLAAREGNEINWDNEYVRQQIAANSKVDLELLESADLIFNTENREQREMVASVTLATSQQDASTENVTNPVIRLWFNDEFWPEYPRPEGRAKALEKFLKLKPERELRTKIVVSLRLYKQTEQWQDQKYVPHATTWIGDKRWEDDVRPVAGNGTQPEGPITRMKRELAEEQSGKQGYESESHGPDESDIPF